MSQPIYADRPPRIQPELPFDEIDIPRPPEHGQDGYARLAQVTLPLITIVGYILVSTLGGAGRNPWLLLPMALSVLASAGVALYSYRAERRRQADADRAYADRLVELNREMHAYHDQQRRFYRFNYPDTTATLRVIEQARDEATRAERTLRSEARLWERRIADRDFGAVRLGMGTLPSTVVYKLGEVREVTTPLARAAMKLADESRFVSDIPVIVSLRAPREEQPGEGDAEEREQAPPTPFSHALAVAGDPAAAYAFVRALLAHFVVFHAPTDTRLCLLAGRREPWAWAAQLPHTVDSESGRLLCFADTPDEHDPEPGEEEGTPVGRFLERLRKTLSQRKIRLQERGDDQQNEQRADPTLPHLLVVADLLDTPHGGDGPLAGVETDAALSILQEEGHALGAAVIFLVPERARVPSGCTAVVEVEATTPASNSRLQHYQRLHFRYTEVGVNTARYVGAADAIERPVELEQAAHALSQLSIRQGAGSSLPAAVPFLDLMECRSLAELCALTQREWDASQQARNAAWLRVRIGRMAGGKPRTLVFSAKRDGVHGVVAGSTGSGKSELLISLITGMAATYDPSVVNFVLVDYKGGSAFDEFKRLPHCVDVITNLRGDRVTRMFTAIQAELRRRQALNTATNTKNIVEYRQRGLHLTGTPYPFLFIIIDEFAEMIADRAEFKAQLETITRVGRAQGVSLILAAQRPSGVTDQMRANIKFRICLRVETPPESREILRRVDAAFLPMGVPGRGYLQVGNEEIELIQVAYTGDPYVDPQRQPRARVIWRGRGGTYDPAQDSPPPELYKAIITTLGDMAAARGVPPQRAPWPDFLPERLSLSAPLIADDPSVPALTSPKYVDDESIERITLGQRREPTLTLNPALNRWLTGSPAWQPTLDWRQRAWRPVVGLIDNPYAGKQLPLVVDLPRGHVLLFGASGWGKTTFIRTLVVSLAATHSVGQLHAYVLDLGGRNLAPLAALPHVGAVISPDEEGYEERVEQLLRELDDLIGARKRSFGEAGATDIVDFNERRPQEALPAVLVAIDNFVEFVQTFGRQGDEDETTLDRFIALARQSKPYGVHFVITANLLGEVPNQLYNLCTERFALHLAEQADYRAILGATVAELADVPGRGYTRVGMQPLSFQVATLAGAQPAGQPGGGETQEIERFARALDEHVAAHGVVGRRPFRVDPLPRAVLLKGLIAREHGLDQGPTFLPKLKNITWRAWEASLDPAKADWLKVAIGVVSGNRPRPLQLEAKKDGVHGLIAGGTGSGKSELLMTLIVGLALNYDPSVLNFVLVDYKGGGAFKPFEGLPHVVEVITNLHKAGVRRMFTAINAEMDRRSRINAETRTKDIVEYRQKGYHARLPYPHLFIIVDEYAEMITENPEFRDELDRITRIGRSLGINLLLASQRPVGVTDQMRANIKLRICLRVEQVDTSRELLRRGDAAFLPSGMPGRGYLQVGNENIELTQVAYTGESFDHAPPTETGERPKFYDVVVRLAEELQAMKQGQPRPRTPWPPPLPTPLTFDDVLSAVYLDPAARPLLSLGRQARLALNPFLAQWLAGQGAWPGVEWGSTALRGVAGLIDDPYAGKQRPLTFDFTRGHAVVFGASGWGKTTLIRSLIVSMAATHSPSEFQAHVLDLGGRNLEVLRSLPHVGTVIMPDERGYEERVQQLWRELNDLVDARKKRFAEAQVGTLVEYNSRRGATVEPAILVAIDNFAEFLDTFGGGGKKDDADSLLDQLVLLVRQGRAYGLHFLITAGRLNVLSSKLYSLFTERSTFRLADSDEYGAIVGSHIGDIEELAGRGFTRVGALPLAFQVALLPRQLDEEGQPRSEGWVVAELGRQMTAAAGGRYAQPLRIDALPKSSSYRQVIGEQIGADPQAAFLDQLKAAMRARWEQNASAEQAEWLRVTLGIASGNRPRTLRLEAKHDGVHGLVAGGTGSGKSELLTTLIIGLALSYSPDILNFVLVDFKGGGAFKPFESLPHCVDLVTNLNRAAVARVFASIDAEMRRRQDLNARTRTKDIVDYRRRGLHLTVEPYPHLVIIIDEYAEMIDANPQYRAQLESITRVGRSLGVNLVLASQRPKGVSDQMRANIKLRICLRVEELDTSRELLRKPDAGLLPSGMPGRGYLQVGSENLELMQVSWAGEEQPDDRAPRAIWPDRPPHPAPPAEETPRLFDAIVMLSGELWRGRAVRRPWPGFLPERFTLETPLARDDGPHTALAPAVTSWINGDLAGLWPGVDWAGDDPGRAALRPPVMLVDDPDQARQEARAPNLGRGHLAVFGDAGSGKTTLLRSIVAALAATHSPDELHLYVLDLGGRSFRSLEGLPHLGAAIYAGEARFKERMQRLFEHLGRLVDTRQRQISEAGANTIYDYNARNPQQALPVVLVLIDNFAELQSSYESLVESTLMPLVGRALGAGVTFVAATSFPNQLGRLFGLFTERLTFRQSNADRYMDIVGRGAVEFDDQPGRGYVQVDRRPLFFQAAQPAGVLDREGRPVGSEAEALQALAAQMQQAARARGTRTRPDPIATLPEIVPLAQLIADAPPPAGRQVAAVLGMGDNLRPALIDLQRLGPHFMIAGPPLSGKTTALHCLLLSLALRYTPQQVAFVLADPQRRLFEYGGERTLAELPHVIAAIAETEQVAELVTRLKAEFAGGAPGRALFVVIDNFDEFSDELERQRELVAELASLIRRYGRSGLHVVVAGTFDGQGVSDLRRRIQSAGYGLGLQTEGALAALRVSRTPAALRDGSLEVGRGYVVKAGQATMLQVASPYHDGAGAEVAPEEMAERAARALDGWVAQVAARHDAARAWWLADGAPPPAQEAPAPQNGKLLAMHELLRRAQLADLARLRAGKPAGAVIELAAQLDEGGRADPARLQQALLTVLVSEYVGMGLPQEGAEQMAASMASDPASLIGQLDSMLPRG